MQHFFVCHLERLDTADRTGPEFADVSRGAYDLDRVAVGPNGSIGVDLQPEAVKVFIEKNWDALTDAVARLSSRR